MDTNTHMEKFKSEGVSFLNTLTKSQLNNIVHTANKQYHSYTFGSKPPILSDAGFDIVKEYLEKKYPQTDALQEIGAIATDKQKVLLPVSMPSMDKIKPDTEGLKIWIQKFNGPYIISCKLDGVSGLYCSIKNDRKLYTRGDGTIGQDISKILPLLTTIPETTDMIVRGEFIVSKTTFEKKYNSKFANIRNMVSGLINRKKTDSIMKDIDFVAYEVIEPLLKPSEQMSFLQKNGFKTVQHELKLSLTNNILSNLLIEWRSNNVYDIDGIIVTDDKLHKRTKSNPDYAFAFKMVISDQVAETHVVDVIWTASKDGYLKPRVRVNPVRIGGVTIEYATGFNGQYIHSNKIGIGAIIQIVRSGDVIPYIKSVTTPAEHAKMPEVDYVWTDTHVDILLADKADDPVVLEKQITAFFTKLEVIGLSSGNVRRLIQAGYNTIPKILKMRLADFMTIEGFKEKLSEKIMNSIKEKVEISSLSRFLAASGSLGRGLGEKKIKPILEAYPNIFVSGETSIDKMKKIQNINGIGKENAKLFVENIPHCISFLNSCGVSLLYQSESSFSNSIVSVENNHLLYGKKLVFTGFRDKSYMDLLETKYKVSFTHSVSKNTFMVVIKSLDETNSKVYQARQLNVPIMRFDDFKAKYRL